MPKLIFPYIIDSSIGSCRDNSLFIPQPMYRILSTASSLQWKDKTTQVVIYYSMHNNNNDPCSSLSPVYPLSAVSRPKSLSGRKGFPHLRMHSWGYTGTN